jgi:hypothetical protein
MVSHNPVKKKGYKSKHFFEGLTYKRLKVEYRKRYTLKIGGYQVGVIWIYRCSCPKGPKLYAEGFSPAVFKIGDKFYSKNLAGQKTYHSIKDLIKMADNQSLLDLTCSPCWIKRYAINIYQNIPVEPITKMDRFNDEKKPAIQQFNFKLSRSKGQKLLKEIYGKGINNHDYDVLHNIATGKTHINEDEKRHSRLYTKYGKIIRYIDEQENKHRVKKQQQYYNTQKEKKEKKPLKERVKIEKPIREKKPLPQRVKKLLAKEKKTKPLSRKVKKALKGNGDIEL